MTGVHSTAAPLLVAIDISNHRHEVLIGVPGKKRWSEIPRPPLTSNRALHPGRLLKSTTMNMKLRLANSHYE